MTPSLIKTEYVPCTILPTNKVEKQVNGNVNIELGYAMTISGNRPEDFENLITLAQKALELIK